MRKSTRIQRCSVYLLCINGIHIMPWCDLHLSFAGTYASQSHLIQRSKFVFPSIIVHSSAYWYEIRENCVRPFAKTKAEIVKYAMSCNCLFRKSKKLAGDLLDSRMPFFLRNNFKLGCASLHPAR